MEHNNVQMLWQAFLEATGEKEITTDKKYDSWYFCNNEKDANALADLVLQGEKRATTSLVAAYEAEKEELPKVGEYSIVTDWSGKAKCIIQTTETFVVPFHQVTAEYAATGSLQATVEGL